MAGCGLQRGLGSRTRHVACRCTGTACVTVANSVRCKKTLPEPQWWRKRAADEAGIFAVQHDGYLPPTAQLLDTVSKPIQAFVLGQCWARFFFYAFKQGVQVSVDTVVVSWASMAARSEQHLTRNAMVELAIDHQFRQQYVASAKCDTYEQLEEPSNAEDIRGSESGTRSAASEVLATCSSSRMVAFVSGRRDHAGWACSVHAWQSRVATRPSRQCIQPADRRRIVESSLMPAVCCIRIWSATETPCEHRSGHRQCSFRRKRLFSNQAVAALRQATTANDGTPLRGMIASAIDI